MFKIDIVVCVREYVIFEVLEVFLYVKWFNVCFFYVFDEDIWFVDVLFIGCNFLIV